MSKFAKFMKANKAVKENAKYPATKSLCDENGKPLDWEIRHITSKEIEDIREKCTIDVPVPGKPNMYRAKLKSDVYIRKMVAASIVYPDLHDAELQDSYGVKTPEDLLMEMVDDAGEYNEFVAFINEFQGLTSMENKVNDAKN